jgi:hypothetical protein
VLRNEAGKPIALGEYTQRPKAGTIEVHLSFRFKDDSLHDEKAVFSQRGVFRPAWYRLRQRRPSFPSYPERQCVAFIGDGGWR